MQRISVLILLIAVLLVGSSYATPSQLSFKVGQEFIYTLDSRVDSLGYTKEKQETPGTYSTMDSTVVVKVTEFKDDQYLFVMNMFGTKVGVGQTSSIDGDTAPEVQELTKSSQALGYDMYFAQKPTGEIVKIWYNTKDSPYYVQVKVSAINAFQTKVVGVGAKDKALENDPVGVHYSNFMGASGSSDTPLTVHKTFNQKDVTKFADPKVSAHNVDLSATTTTAVHNSGFIHSSNVKQSTILINANTAAHASKKTSSGSVDGAEDLTGFNMDMRAHGNLNINFQKLATVGSSFISNGFGFDDLDSNKDMVPSDTFSAASTIIQQSIQPVANLDNPETAVSDLLAVTDTNKVTVLLRELTFAIQHDDSLINTVEAHLNKEGMLSNKITRDRLFFLLAASGKSRAQDALIRFGLQSKDPETQIHALLSAGSAVSPSNALLQAAWNVFESSEHDAELHNTALLSFSNIIRNADNAVSSKGVDMIRSILVDSVYRESHADMAVASLNALANIGPIAVDILTIPEIAYTHNDFRVRVAAVNFLEQYPESDLAKEFLRDIAHKDKSLDLRFAATRALRETFNTPLDTVDYGVVSDSYFPYNKSFDKNFKVGGDIINAQFDAELFIGTNFDCNHEYFNYEGLAQAKGDASVFGVDKSLFLAKAIYGKRQGSVVGNELLLTVFDKTIYQKQIPTVDCQEHTYKLFHTAPGFSVQYTVWVSVVPITFKASANLELSAEWGWNICDDKLSAMVELIPSGTLKISGDAEINLLVIRGGLELAASFNTALIPQAYIHGSLCTIGIDVERKSVPMSAYFEGYYVWKKCKFLFFDCHWGRHHENKFWSWSERSHDEVIFRKEWQIAH